MRRYCEVCGVELQRRANESPAKFRERRYCGRRCFGAAIRNRPKGQVQYNRAEHDPTPEQIRAKCREIQSGWTDKVEASRRAMGRRRVKTLECRIVTEGRA